MNRLGKVHDRDVRLKIELLFTNLDGFIRIETADNLIYQNIMSHFMDLKEELLGEALLEEMSKGLDEIDKERRKRKEQE